MAEGNATIAALRAASAAPVGPSGPVALAYPWMARQGSELVIPVRPSTPPRDPKFRNPPNPAPPAPSPRPPAPPRTWPGRGGGGGGGGRGEPGGRFIVDDGGGRPGGRGEPGGRFMIDQPQGSPPPDAQPSETPPFTNIDLGLIDYAQPLPFAELGPAEPVAVEQFAAEEPTPYMPDVREREDAPVSVAPAARKADEAVQPQMSVIEMLQQMVPPPPVAAPPPVQAPASDLELLDFIQPAPAEDAPVQAAPAPQKAPQPVQPEIDPMLLRYLMMPGFSEMAEL